MALCRVPAPCYNPTPLRRLAARRSVPRPPADTGVPMKNFLRALRHAWPYRRRFCRVRRLRRPGRRALGPQLHVHLPRPQAAQQQADPAPVGGRLHRRGPGRHRQVRAGKPEAPGHAARPGEAADQPRSRKAEAQRHQRRRPGRTPPRRRPRQPLALPGRPQIHLPPGADRPLPDPRLGHRPPRPLRRRQVLLRVRARNRSSAASSI